MKRDPSKRARWKKKDQDNERGRTAIRYRAYPTPSQTGKVMRIAGSCRFVKNLAKEQWDLARRFGTRSPSYTRQSADLKELRDDPKLTPGWPRPRPKSSNRRSVTPIPPTSGSSPASPAIRFGPSAAAGRASGIPRM